MNLPKITSPLTKALRTSEGILIYVVNLIIGIGTVIDPSKLPHTLATVVVGALTVAHLIARTAIKAVAVQKGVGLEPPIDPRSLVDKIAAEVSSSVGGIGGAGIEDLRNVVELAVAKGVKAGGVTSASDPAETLLPKPPPVV